MVLVEIIGLSQDGREVLEQYQAMYRKSLLSLALATRGPIEVGNDPYLWEKIDDMRFVNGKKMMRIANVTFVNFSGPEILLSSIASAVNADEIDAIEEGDYRFMTR